MVNGYSGYGPPHYGALSFDMQKGCVDSLDGVRGGRALDVVVHTDTEGWASILEAVRQRWPDAPEDASGGVVVRHVPADAGATAAYDDPIDLGDFCQAVREAVAESP